MCTDTALTRLPNIASRHPLYIWSVQKQRQDCVWMGVCVGYIWENHLCEQAYRAIYRSEESRNRTERCEAQRSDDDARCQLMFWKDSLHVDFSAEEDAMRSRAGRRTSTLLVWRQALVGGRHVLVGSGRGDLLWEKLALVLGSDAVEDAHGQLEGRHVVLPVPVREAVLVADRRRPLIGNLLPEVRFEIECHLRNQPLNVPAKIASGEWNSSQIIHMSGEARTVRLE